MGWATFKVTFKPAGEMAHGNLKEIVVSLSASGADSALADARMLLGLSADKFRSVAVVMDSQKT